MAIQVVICDDAAADRDYVEAMVKRWAQARDVAVELRQYTSAENLLFCLADQGGADIALLDIEMGAMDGVTLAKRLRRDSETMQIVFITGYSDYIAEGFQLFLCGDPGAGSGKALQKRANAAVGNAGGDSAGAHLLHSLCRCPGQLCQHSHSPMLHGEDDSAGAGAEPGRPVLSGGAVSHC